MIAPAPYKLKCPKCGYTKVVALKSDVLNFAEMNNICPRCNTEMEVIELNLFDRLLLNLKINK